jgi:hypothetical protein
MKNLPSRRDLLVIAASVLLSLAIDWVDAATGEKYELFVLYFIPVGFSAWVVGRSAGVLLSLVSAAAWFQSDILSRLDYSLPVESWDVVMRLVSFLAIAWTLSAVKTELLREKKLNAELSDAMAEIKTLRGILPMCSFCRKIRDDQNRWVPLEKYIADHSEAKVSHGLCPRCYAKHYGDADGT